MSREPASQIDPDTIRTVISGNRKALALFEAVRGFFGQHLHFLAKNTDQGATSEWRLKVDECDPDHLMVRWVEVTIKIAHEHAPVSIVHELLHLALLMDGFPMYWPDKKYDEESIALYGPISNIVGHDLFKEQFAAIGLGATIVPNPQPNRDRTLASWLDRFCRCPKSFAAVQWARQIYFCAWMTDELLGTASERQACLATVGADLETDMNWLPDWFKRREFADARRYRRSIRQALKEMEIPEQPLYVLARVGGGIALQPCQ